MDILVYIYIYICIHIHIGRLEEDCRPLAEELRVLCRRKVVPPGGPEEAFFFFISKGNFINQYEQSQG